MGIYLKQLSDKSKNFTFPSMPKESIKITRQTSYQDYDIIGTGRKSFPSGMQNSPVEWSGTFFGNNRKNMSSLVQKYVKPADCIAKLTAWQNSGTPLNLIVSEAGINMDVTISKFVYRPTGGFGDYVYEITFTPFVELKVYTTKELSTSKSAKKKSKKSRTNTKKTSTKKKTYTIKKGDTLCKISKKYYKTESKWKTIYNANKKVIEAAAKKHKRKSSSTGKYIYPGTKLTIP